MEKTFSFNDWIKRMGHTSTSAALALGVSKSTIANYRAGLSRTSNKPIDLPIPIIKQCQQLEREKLAYLGEDVLTETAPDPATNYVKPTPEAIGDARCAAALTLAQAGAVVHTNARQWQLWELGARRMHPAIFELFLLKCKR